MQGGPGDGASLLFSCPPIRSLRVTWRLGLPVRRLPRRRPGTVESMDTRRFRDRAEAGRLLVERLRGYSGRDDVVVLALPRGGVPVAYEVAKALGATLHVFVVRKLGVPGHEER